MRQSHLSSNIPYNDGSSESEEYQDDLPGNFPSLFHGKEPPVLSRRPSSGLAPVIALFPYRVKEKRVKK